MGTHRIEIDDTAHAGPIHLRQLTAHAYAFGDLPSFSHTWRNSTLKTLTLKWQTLAPQLTWLISHYHVFSTLKTKSPLAIVPICCYFIQLQAEKLKSACSIFPLITVGSWKWTRSEELSSSNLVLHQHAISIMLHFQGQHVKFKLPKVLTLPASQTKCKVFVMAGQTAQRLLQLNKKYVSTHFHILSEIYMRSRSLNWASAQLNRSYHLPKLKPLTSVACM